MCGIAGILNKEGIRSSDLHSMSTILRHRGPDDEVFFISGNTVTSRFYKGNDTIPELASIPHISEYHQDAACQIGLMHRRLSILDLSATGHQPMSYNQYTIVFNGEIYNYKELKSELAGKGLTFTSDSDTEVILVAYQYWGEECVKHFVGMWAFAIYDKEKQHLFYRGIVLELNHFIIFKIKWALLLLQKLKHY